MQLRDQKKCYYNKFIWLLFLLDIGIELGNLVFE